MTDKTRCVIYGRVSSKKQARNEKTSLRVQLDDCRAYAARQGWEVVKEYTDSYSAYQTAWEDREGLYAAYNEASELGVDVLLFWGGDTGRLSRDTNEGMAVLVSFFQIEVDVYDSNGKLWTGEDNELLSFISFWAKKNEVRDFTRRQKANKRQRAQEGYLPISQPPYGYDLTEDDKLVKNKGEAAIVRELYRRYAKENVSIGLLTNDLNEKGIPSPRGGTWSKTTISRILGSSTYKGQYVYQKTKAIANKVYKTAGVEDHIVVAVPAIIDTRVWDRVQVRKSRQKSHFVDSQANNRFALRGRIRCRECGYALSRREVTQMIWQKVKSSKGETKVRSPKIYRYYVHSRNREECVPELRTIKQDLLDQVVFQSAHAIISDPDEIERRIEVMRGQADEINADTHDRIEANKEAEIVAQRKLEKFLSTNAGAATQKTLDNVIANTEKEISRLRAERQTLENTLAPVPDVDADAIRQLYNSSDFEYLREYLGETDAEDMLPNEPYDSISLDLVEKLYEEIGLSVEVGYDPETKHRYALINTELKTEQVSINGTQDGIHGDWKLLVGKKSE